MKEISFLRGKYTQVTKKKEVQEIKWWILLPFHLDQSKVLKEIATINLHFQKNIHCNFYFIKDRHDLGNEASSQEKEASEAW